MEAKVTEETTKIPNFMKTRWVRLKLVRADICYMSFEHRIGLKLLLSELDDSEQYIYTIEINSYPKSKWIRFLDINKIFTQFETKTEIDIKILISLLNRIRKKEVVLVPSMAREYISTL